ncbi:MAG: hypothetical protein ACFNNL_07845 [Kingella oralis]
MAHRHFGKPIMFGLISSPPFHFRFQPCALRCGITIYTQIKDLDKWIKLPQPFVQPETEHGVSPPYPLFPLP